MLYGRFIDIFVKMTFWPLWPQMTSDWPLTHIMDRRSHADAYASFMVMLCYMVEL